VGGELNGFTVSEESRQRYGPADRDRKTLADRPQASATYLWAGRPGTNARIRHRPTATPKSWHYTGSNRRKRARA